MLRRWKINRLFRITILYFRKGKSYSQANLLINLRYQSEQFIEDIDSISSAGIPIYALQGKGGGIEIAEDFVLSKSLLSENEKQQIMSALQGLDNTAIQHENRASNKNFPHSLKWKIPVG